MRKFILKIGKRNKCSPFSKGTTYHLKSKATTRAKSLRKKGEETRVVRSKKGYTLFTHR